MHPAIVDSSKLQPPDDRRLRFRDLLDDPGVLLQATSATLNDPRAFRSRAELRIGAELEPAASHVVPDSELRFDNTPSEVVATDAKGTPLTLAPGDPGSVEVFIEDTVIFSDGFETGNTSAWSSTSP